MSTQFSFRRFGMLFQKHTAEQYKAYLMSFAVLTGLMALLFGFIAYMQPSPIDANMQSFLYTMPLLLTGAIFTSTVFSALGDKKKAMAQLMLPASHFEKYLVAWLISFVIFIVLYTVSFYGVLSIVVSLDDWRGQEKEYLNLVSEGRFWDVVGAYALVHAIALLGSIYFEKAHFIKTAFVFLVFMLVLVLLNQQVMELVLGIEINAFPFSTISFMEGEQKWTVKAPETMGKWINNYLPFLVVVIVWVAAYARLREKQV